MQRTEYSHALEEARYAVTKASYEVKWLLAHLARKRFDPNQPRVPAGNRDGGQWTAGGSGGGRTQVAARVPRVVQPRQRTPPGRRPVDSGGGVEWLTPAEAIALNSSNVPAESLANVLRNHSPYWKPEPRMVVSAEGAIKANQSATAEAAERLREINAWLWRYEPTPSLLNPNGKPIGYVHRDADERVRTIRTREEFDLLLTRLVIYASPHSRANYRGQVFLRHDGVEIGIRQSDDNGPTIDIFRNGPEKPPVTRIHLLGGGKFAAHIIEKLHYKTGASHMHRPKIQRNVIPVVFSRCDEIMKNSESSLREYATRYAVYPGDPNNFAFTLQVIIDAFGSDRKTLEAALRYFLTHIIGNGLAPMNFENATDYEYGPVTKYGVRPQEIIDNIMAAWMEGGDYFVDDFELMFGWEHHCGAFIQHDEPGSSIRGDS